MSSVRSCFDKLRDETDAWKEPSNFKFLIFIKFLLSCFSLFELLGACVTSLRIQFKKKDIGLPVLMRMAVA